MHGNVDTWSRYPSVFVPELDTSLTHGSVVILLDFDIAAEQNRDTKIKVLKDATILVYLKCYGINGNCSMLKMVC